MNHIDLIIEAYNKNEKRKYGNFFVGRKSFDDLMNDKSTSVSKEDLCKIVELAKKDNYLKWRATDYILSVITDSKKINQEIAISFVKQFLQDDNYYKNFCKERICHYLTIKGGKIKSQHIENIFKFDIFASKQDLADYVFEQSKKSVRCFGSLISLYPNYLSENQAALVRNRIKKIITKFKANERNASFLLKSLCSKEICDWINEDDELKENILKFFPLLNNRDVQSEKMLVGKNILNFYKNDAQRLKKVQEILIELVCKSNYRHEKRILQILSVEGTSPREAFATIVKFNRRVDFLCEHFKELEKLRVLI